MILKKILKLKLSSNLKIFLFQIFIQIILIIYKDCMFQK